MNGKNFILLPFCFLLIFNSVLGQENLNAKTYFRHFKLKKIPASVGEPFTIRQFYPDSPDTLIHADRIFFENVTIRKIKYCKMDYRLQNEIVQSITIYLTGQKNYDAARKQAQKEFGPYTLILNDDEDILAWIPKNHERKIQVTLQRKNKEWGSEMIIAPLRP